MCGLQLHQGERVLRMGILGLDVGKKRVGVAVSDPEEKIALPLEVVERERAVERIAELSVEHGCKEIVCGLPLKMDGAIGEQAEDVLAFVAELAKRLDIPIATLDERLSTKQAEKILKAKDKEKIDKLSAQIILQTFLERRDKNTEE